MFYQVWTEKGGVNYTLTATEMIGQAVMKLQNKTLRVTTTTVRTSKGSRYHTIIIMNGVR